MTHIVDTQATTGPRGSVEDGNPTMCGKPIAVIQFTMVNVVWSAVAARNISYCEECFELSRIWEAVRE